MQKDFDFEYLPQILYGHKPVRNSFFPHLGRAARALDMAFTENSRRNGLALTYDQFMLLVAVRENPSATQQELADNLCRERTAVVHALLALAREGWLEKHSSTEDRRKSVYVPTAKAMDMWEKFGGTVWETLEQGEAGISRRELADCINTLVKIFCNYRPAQRIYQRRETSPE